MAVAANTVQDGFTSLSQGMDGGRATNALPRNQYAFGMNVTARGEYIKTRPPFNQFSLIFASQQDMTFYTTGRYQGDEWFVPTSGESFNLVSISGHIFRLILQPLLGPWCVTVEDLTPANDPNMSTLPKAWFVQADIYMIIQDGVDAA